MKKIVITIVFLLGIIMLTSCKREISYIVDKNEVSFIQIIDVTGHGDEVTYSVLVQINDDELNDFIDDLAKVTFVQHYGEPQGLFGTCIYIGYSNLDYEIIGSEYIERSNSNNKVISWHNYYASLTEYEDLIEKYTS